MASAGGFCCQTATCLKASAPPASLGGWDPSGEHRSLLGLATKLEEENAGLTLSWGGAGRSEQRGLCPQRDTKTPGIQQGVKPGCTGQSVYTHRHIYPGATTQCNSKAEQQGGNPAVGEYRPHLASVGIFPCPSASWSSASPCAPGKGCIPSSTRAPGWQEQVNWVVWGADDFPSIGEVMKTRGRINHFRRVGGGLSVWSGRLRKAQLGHAWAGAWESRILAQQHCASVHHHDQG